MHLPNLEIRGFRGIDSLSLPSLSCVTLLTGENGVGKSSVLDAIQVYASCGNVDVILKLLMNRDDFISVDDFGSGARGYIPNIKSLFTNTEDGKHPPPPMLIGNGSKQSDLEMSLIENESGLDEDEIAVYLKQAIGSNRRTFSVSPSRINPFGDTTKATRVLNPDTRWIETSKSWPTPLNCRLVGTNNMSNGEVGYLWRDVVLSWGEEVILQAINLVSEPKVERITVVGDDQRCGSVDSRRVIVKLQDSSMPVPLRSLGGGVLRLFEIALALVSCRKGLLLIESVENTIHHSVQTELWRLILRTAEVANVQVFATTQSVDSVSGLARAVTDTSIECNLFRLQHIEGKLRGVAYDSRDLAIATTRNIEFR